MAKLIQDNKVKNQVKWYLLDQIVLIEKESSKRDMRN
jgi:hypothetical protein